MILGIYSLIACYYYCNNQDIILGDILDCGCVSRPRYLLFHTFQRDHVFPILVSLEESLNELFQYVNIS